MSTISGEIRCNGKSLYIPEDLHFHEELPVKVILKSLLPKAALKLALEAADQISLDLEKSCYEAFYVEFKFSLFYGKIFLVN